MAKSKNIKKIFDGKLIQLFTKAERLPNGYMAHLEIVKHPGAVLIVPFLNKQEVIMIRQYRPVIGKYIWELPAGTLHANESPLKCAKRELLEEIGYVGRKWKKLHHIYPTPGYTNEKILIFKASGLKKAVLQKQEDEIISLRPFKKPEIRDLLDCGKIVDAKTICALKLSGVL